MTATTQFKILEIHEPVWVEKKQLSLQNALKKWLTQKFRTKQKILTTKDDLYKTSVAIKEDMYKLSERLESRIWTTLITLVVMILGLYATIIFKH